jgi:alkylhydroperoxidase/carboxymuconolactone decarboxylase family protein YurZ
MEKDPLEILKEKGAELFNNIAAGKKLAYSDGALSAKHKLLIAMALDVVLGSANGVKFLAAQAMKAGASKDEILDALNVVYFASGVVSVYTAAQGLVDIL